MSAYGTGLLKRTRRTSGEMEALDAALCEIVEQFRPVTVRQEDIEIDGRPTYVYVLTDFDPLGVSIAEKVEEELRVRAPASEIIFERLAVDRKQSDRGDPPTRPTRGSDPRAARVRRVHGTDSVELDAIPPDELRKLVGDSIDGHMEPWRLGQFRMVEQEEREALRSMFGGAA